MNHKTSKQVIVMRKDLNMRKGKMIAQGAHASVKVILDNLFNDDEYVNSKFIEIEPNTAIKDWIEGSFTKICVYVNSESELLDVYNKAKNAGILCALITDSGKTEFNGVPTKTCCAIGPDWDVKIDSITGNLKLL